MNNLILTLGQAALLLASVVAVLGLVYVAAWLLAGIVRLARQLSNPGRQHRPTPYRVGGGVRKW